MFSFPSVSTTDLIISVKTTAALNQSNEELYPISEKAVYEYNTKFTAEKYPKVLQIFSHLKMQVGTRNKN